MVSVAPEGPPPVMIWTLSNMLNTSMTESTSIVSTMGLICGSEMQKMRRRNPAPSSSADSCCSSGTSCSAAR